MMLSSVFWLLTMSYLLSHEPDLDAFFYLSDSHQKHPQSQTWKRHLNLRHRRKVCLSINPCPRYLFGLVRIKYEISRYIPANLENMFSKYARTVPDKLTRHELWQMTEANRNAFDFFGWSVPSLFLSSDLSLSLFLSINCVKMETGQRVKWSGECSTYWPKTRMVTYPKKLLGDASMGACSTTAPSLELLLKRLTNDTLTVSLLSRLMS